MKRILKEEFLSPSPSWVSDAGRTKQDIVQMYKAASAISNFVFMSRGKTYTYDELAGLDKNSTFDEKVQNLQTQLGEIAGLRYWLVANEGSNLVALHVNDPDPLIKEKLHALESQLAGNPLLSHN